MGVKKLLVYLRELCPEIVQTIELDKMKGYRIAIDIAVLTYANKSQFISRVAPKLDLVNEDVNYDDCTMFMVKQILVLYSRFLSVGCVPVTVFDGKAPALKGGTKRQRAGKSTSRKDNIAGLRRIAKSLLTDNSFCLSEDDFKFLMSFPKPIKTIDDIRSRLLAEVKSFITVTSDDYFKLETIFSNLGLPYIRAESEAEMTCAQMARHKDVLAIYTTDSDCLIYGCPIMINKVTYMNNSIIPVSPKAQCYTFENALKVTGLNNMQFIDFCIMCGTDFNPNSEGFGPDTNMRLLKHHGSIPKMIAARNAVQVRLDRNPYEELDEMDKLLIKYDPSVLNYDEVRCFLTSPVKYDKNALKLRVADNQFEIAFDALSSFLGGDVFAKIMDVSKLIVQRLQNVSKFMKH